MVRPPCCDKLNVKKGPWTAEEDAKLLAYTNTHGTGNWSTVPKRAGLKRCGKSCRLRWTNYLRPNLNHDNFSPEEEECIIRIHETLGSRWTIIANALPGRTDNDVKNYWNTKLSKKLLQRGIDPVTHKPIPQLYQSIGSLPTLTAANGAAAIRARHRSGTSHDARISNLNRDLKNIFLSRSIPMPKTISSSSDHMSTYQDPRLRNSNPFSTAIVDASSSSFSSMEVTQPYNEASSSSTMSMPMAEQHKAEPPKPVDHFDWTDFLVKDVFGAHGESMGSSSAQVKDDDSKGPSDKYPRLPRDGYASEFYDGVDGEVGDGSSAGTSTSFIHELLDHDREMQLEFPDHWIIPSV